MANKCDCAELDRLTPKEARIPCPHRSRLRDIERMVASPRVLSGFLLADTSKLSIHDMRTVGKLLPHLAACAKFVEEHGEVTAHVLGASGACHAAREALLGLLTAERGSDG